MTAYRPLVLLNNQVTVQPQADTLDITTSMYSYVGTWSGSSNVTGYVGQTRPVSLMNAYTDRIFITDVGTGGSEWYWDGSRYRVVGGQVILKNSTTKNDTTAAANIASTVATPTLITDYYLPLGIMKAGDILEVAVLRSKSASDATGVFATFIYFGKLGTTSDPVANIGGIAASNISRRGMQAFKLVDNNNVIKIVPDGDSLGLTNLALVNQTQTDIGLSTTQLKLSIFGYWSPTTTGQTATVQDLQITLKTCG